MIYLWYYNLLLVKKIISSTCVINILNKKEIGYCWVSITMFQELTSGSHPHEHRNNSKLYFTDGK